MAWAPVRIIFLERLLAVRPLGGLALLTSDNAACGKELFIIKAKLLVSVLIIDARNGTTTLLFSHAPYMA